MFRRREARALKWRRFEGHQKLWTLHRPWEGLHAGILEATGRCECGRELEVTHSGYQLILLCFHCSRYALYDSPEWAQRQDAARRCRMPEESRLDLQEVTVSVPAEDGEAFAFILVAAERGFQSLPDPDGFGQQDHNPAKWLEIIVEELGEAAKARLEADRPGDMAGVLDEWVQVAAVAMAAVGSLLRSSGVTSPADQERFVATMISRRAEQ